ncbi:RNA-directed DNA polymerase, eukaryota, reverse transcriptase zinc-binding domain protein [Tanacetum coccineum]
MQELREDTFFGNKNDDAHEHERVLDIASLFNIPGVTHDTFMLRVFSITLIEAAKRWVDRLSTGTINSWDLLKKAFIQRLGKGPILGMTPAKALTAIQTMADHSQKWHDGSSSRNIDNASNFEGIAAIVNKLDSLGAHLDKECPLNEEVKSVKEVKYGEFGRSSPFNNGAKYCVGPSGYYTRVDNRIMENILVRIDKFLFPSDFVVIDMLKTHNETMILGRPFLATIHAEIDVFNKEISLGIMDDRVTFDMDKRIYNFTTHVGKVYMVNSILNDEPSTSSNALKKTRMLKPDINTPSAHFCNPVKQECNGILKVWPTCDPTMKLCNGGNEIYGVDEQGTLKYWHCQLEDERKSMRGDGLSFPDFLLVRYEINQGDGELGLAKDPRARSFYDYKWVFDLKINQLTDEYELGIGKKGHMLEDILEYCEKVQGDNTNWWNDHRFEEDERQESGLDIKEYDPPKVQRNDPKRTGHGRKGPKKDIERLESNLKTRSHNKEIEFEVTSTRIHVGIRVCSGYAGQEFISCHNHSKKDNMDDDDDVLDVLGLDYSIDERFKRRRGLAEFDNTKTEEVMQVEEVVRGVRNVERVMERTNKVDVATYVYRMTRIRAVGYRQVNVLEFFDCLGPQQGLEDLREEEAGFQLQAEEFDLMAAAGDIDEIEEFNANCILMANLQQASTSGTQTDKALVYDSDGSAKSLYNGRVLLEKHDPPTVYDSEETLQLAQEIRLKMK